MKLLVVASFAILACVPTAASEAQYYDFQGAVDSAHVLAVKVKQSNADNDAVLETRSQIESVIARIRTAIETLRRDSATQSTDIAPQKSDFSSRTIALKIYDRTPEEFQISINNQNARLQSARARPNNNNEIQAIQQQVAVLEDLKRQNDSILSAAKRIDALSVQEAQYTQHLNTLENDLRQVDSEIRNRLQQIKEQGDYVVTASIIYGIAFGMILVGFFWTVHRYESVRNEVFQGSVGLQFVTLFTVVIAIFLFGIFGKLEGKELAGILGTLCGVILGSGTSSYLHARAGRKEKEAG
jgi:hypothetical protein